MCYILGRWRRTASAIETGVLPFWSRGNFKPSFADITVWSGLVSWSWSWTIPLNYSVKKHHGNTLCGLCYLSLMWSSVRTKQYRVRVCIMYFVCEQTVLLSSTRGFVEYLPTALRTTILTTVCLIVRTPGCCSARTSRREVLTSLQWTGSYSSTLRTKRPSTYTGWAEPREDRAERAGKHVPKYTITGERS